MVSKPSDFPRTPTPQEQLRAAIEEGLTARKGSGRLQFLVTSSGDVLTEVLREYRAAGWNVGVESRGSRGQQHRYLLKFSRP